MELETINQIRGKRDSIRGKIKSADFAVYNSYAYGDENEYSFKGLVGGIEALLTDLSTLTRGPRILVKLSTGKERKEIVSHLTRIDNHFDSPSNYLPQFEELKKLLRSYNLRNFTERQIEFQAEIEETHKIKLELQQELVEVKKIRKGIDDKNSTIKADAEYTASKLEEIEAQLEKILNRKDELVEQTDSLENINIDLGSIKETASEHLEEIKLSMTESKSNEKLITQFSSKVQNKDQRLDELEQNIIVSNERLNEYEKERVKILKDAAQLIESAKKALNYKTAEGISASFQTQYVNSNNPKVIAGWIIGAIICLLGTIGLGIWVLHTAPDQIGILIGRISLLPLPIIGAIFCANQFTKQKNIIEDYAYKMVLSKAIVGFSEQLKKNGTESNEEYIHYVKTALEEIHKDPLRKRERNKRSENKPSSLNELIETAEKIIKLSKPD